MAGQSGTFYGQDVLVGLSTRLTLQDDYDVSYEHAKCRCYSCYCLLWYERRREALPCQRHD